METIGERIKEFAKNKFNSQTALAEALDLSVQTLSGYTNNRSFPNDEFFKKLAALDCNLHWLLTGEGEMLYKPDENAEKLEQIKAIVNSSPPL